MKRQPDLVRADRPGLNYTAVALYALRRLPPALREELRRTGEWEDIVAWAMVAAVEGWRQGWDFRTTYNAAGRYIYHALRSAAYRRGSRERYGSKMPYLRKEYPCDLAEERRKP